MKIIPSSMELIFWGKFANNLLFNYVIQRQRTGHLMFCSYQQQFIIVLALSKSKLFLLPKTIWTFNQNYLRLMVSKCVWFLLFQCSEQPSFSTKLSLSGTLPIWEDQIYLINFIYLPTPPPFSSDVPGPLLQIFR